MSFMRSRWEDDATHCDGCHICQKNTPYLKFANDTDQAPDIV